MKEDRLKVIIEENNFFANLLPYMGLQHEVSGINKFKTLLERVAMHEPDEEKITYEEGSTTIMQNLNNPILNELFIKITNIIKFFCKMYDHYEKLKERKGGKWHETKDRLNISMN